MSASRPELYAHRILSLLFTEPGLSRADLAERLGIDRGNITRIVRQLLDQGMVDQGLGDRGMMDRGMGVRKQQPVRDPGEQRSQGRRRIPLQINDRKLCFLGVELQGGRIAVAGITPYGTLLGGNRYPIVPKMPEHLLSSIIHAIRTERETLEGSGRRVLGVGIGVSGLVDPARGKILHSRDLGITAGPLELQAPLERQLQLPVAVDNDARCCCYDVMTYGAFRHRRDFLYLFCDTEEDPQDPRRFSRFALGSALVLEGQLRHGSNSIAGEFRSILTPDDIHGQFAPAVSPSALSASSPSPSPSPEDGIRAIRSNPEGRSRILLELSRHLGFLANYLDLEAIFLGGGIEAYRQEMEPLLKDAVRTTWLYAERYPKPVDIHFAATGDKPALRGAAALIARNLFLPDKAPDKAPERLPDRGPKLDNTPPFMV